ncbi:UNVERIFIED_CONTAM: hypothetical protein FKN15_029634 [Acipenser sinensis]
MKKVRERLLRETELTLGDAEKICHASKFAQLHIKTFDLSTGSNAVASAAESAVVDVVTRDKRRHTEHKNSTQISNKMYECTQCGTMHQARKCPAYGKSCANCNGKNHFARMCFTKHKNQKKELCIP